MKMMAAVQEEAILSLLNFIILLSSNVVRPSSSMREFGTNHAERNESFRLRMLLAFFSTFPCSPTLLSSIFVI
jgi:hypothetical protein